MSKGLGSNLDKDKEIAYDLNLEPEDDDDEVPLEQCSICVELLSNKHNDYTVVKLCCLHEFHLDI
ncbi:unnamed protein product [Arabis nemorensis]|uniref:Uncharacterized protein n=1 Tax=Arabis nemorensis TaxID=586526 RepID=A0A565CPL0_9BRAS|nr:unnamed protein product [Arabis nemorensis]